MSEGAGNNSLNAIDFPVNFLTGSFAKLSTVLQVEKIPYLSAVYRLALGQVFGAAHASGADAGHPMVHFLLWHIGMAIRSRGFEPGIGPGG